MLEDGGGHEPPQPGELWVRDTEPQSLEKEFRFVLSVTQDIHRIGAVKWASFGMQDQSCTFEEWLAWTMGNGGADCIYPIE